MGGGVMDAGRVGPRSSGLLGACRRERDMLGLVDSVLRILSCVDRLSAHRRELDNTARSCLGARAAMVDDIERPQTEAVIFDVAR